MCRGITANKKYAGKFVAMPSFNSRRVLASGRDPAHVREKAVRKGFQSPVVVFIPGHKMYCVF